MKANLRLGPFDVFPAELSPALGERGQYVYAYYRPGEYQPFYVGKGSRTRVLDHWNSATKTPSEPEYQQVSEIRKILQKGRIPTIKLLAYSLDESDEPRHAVAERVLQDAFGIQRIINKRPGVERLTETRGSLVQMREDSASRRPICLESVVAGYSMAKQVDRSDLGKIASEFKVPVLLVGLSNTYHSAYDDDTQAEMARKYWNLNKFENTSLPRLLSATTAILVAWSSKVPSADGKPVIVGAWRCNGTKHTYHKKFDRYEFPTTPDYALRKRLLGLGLTGSGNNWQGQSIFVPK